MFEVKQMHMKGLFLIIPKIYTDERGFFAETYKESEFISAGIDRPFVQDNHSFSKKGVLRGLHYQSGEHAQGKIVRCISGLIFDVAVDIRRHSETFGQWYGVILSAENFYQMYIPEGFAHGYYTISETAEVLYKTTREYAPNADNGIIWNDPEIGIYWPSFQPILSDKDRLHPRLSEIRTEL